MVGSSGVYEALKKLFVTDKDGHIIVDEATSTTLALESGGNLANIKAKTDNLDVPLSTLSVSGTFSVGGTILDPTAARNIPVWRAPFACTVTAVKGYRVGGTGATINARLNGASNHLASALSLTSAGTWMDGGTVQNTAYAVGSALEIMIVSLTGSLTELGIQVDYTRP